MSDPSGRWHADHEDFSRLLDHLEVQLRAFHAGARPNYGLIRDIVHYLADYGDQVHHRCEDVAFERMVQRDPGLQLPINRLLQEHRVIAAAGQALLQLLDEVDSDVIVPRDAIESAAATYLVYYRHHIRSEEHAFIPRARELLTREDWTAITAARATAQDATDAAKPARRYAALLERIGQDAAD